MTRRPDDDLIAPRVLSHYRQMLVMPGWTASRFIQLCHLANRTPEEIGAMAALQPSQTRMYMGSERFPAPVSLHFAVLDAVLKERNFGEPWAPIIPMNLLERSK